MVAQVQLLGIDWGSSNRRAYVINAGGDCLRKQQDGEGALAARGRFAASLQQLRRQLEVDAQAAPGQAQQAAPVVLSGMVGSAQGWQEVAYLDSSVPLARLPDHLVPVTDAPGCFIVPGYCHRSGDGVDVMRGEETQLLGAVALGVGDGWIVLPGTHCKWVELSAGRIVRLTSYMTGELFAALRSSGTLAALMAEGTDGADDVALLTGAQRAQALHPLSHTLFEARSLVVTGAMPPEHTRSYVSGLLIGTEFAAQRPQMPAAAPVLSLLGAPALCAPYRSIARQLGFIARLIDPDQAYCAALARFMEKV